MLIPGVHLSPTKVRMTSAPRRLQVNRGLLIFTLRRGEDTSSPHNIP